MVLPRRHPDRRADGKRVYERVAAAYGAPTGRRLLRRAVDAGQLLVTTTGADPQPT